jgi:plasmid stabilization system protein ParE
MRSVRWTSLAVNDFKAIPYVVTSRVTQSEAIQVVRVWHGAQQRQE